MILLIDNYDSFTYNLYQYLGELHEPIQVVRNDAITLEEIEQMKPGAIVISPGPGHPNTGGISIPVIKRFLGVIPILGVCLGHQAIGAAFGAEIVHANEPIHGKTDTISLAADCPLFYGLPERLSVARYHSLVIDAQTLPDCLSIVAHADNGEIMAVAHQNAAVYGLQFHPESVMTKFGKKILRNFITKVAGLPVKTEDFEQSVVPAAERNLLKPFLKKVIDSEDLSTEEAMQAMECIMEGAATDAQIGSFLTGLRMKGETIEEITGFARAMRKKAASIPSKDAVDIVGTGGDLSNTFNISTTAAFIVAGAGVTVAKHGNRSVSSRSGSADVLETLGVSIDLSPEDAETCLKELSLSFLFAPCFHKSMRFAASPRKEIGVRSVFNILGPLSNPAAAAYMVLGVYDRSLLEPMAKVLLNLGVTSAMVVHGTDGLDEITTAAATEICEVQDGKLIKYEITPEQFGFKRANKEDLVGGTPEENASITRSILEGMDGPKRDIALLNAAVAIYTAKKAGSIEEGLAMAVESVRSGAALAKLEALKKITKELRG